MGDLITNESSKHVDLAKIERQDQGETALFFWISPANVWVEALKLRMEKEMTRRKFGLL